MKHSAKAIAIPLLVTLMLLTGAASLLSAQEPLAPMQWEKRSFEGSTTYSSVILGGERVVEATANDSASALYRAEPVNLVATPYLHWRWRTEATTTQGVDERSKAGDDFRARIYLVRRGGLAFWRTKAINYVWAKEQAIDSRWPNPFAGQNVQMWAVDSGDAGAGQWQTHMRDVRADWFTAFGETIDNLDGLALMTDTDNAGGSSRSWYADIYFSASP